MENSIKNKFLLFRNNEVSLVQEEKSKKRPDKSKSIGYKPLLLFSIEKSVPKDDERTFTFATIIILLLVLS